MAGRPARNTTGPGDYTAKEKERLLLEHKEEIAEAQKAKGLQTAIDVENEANGIFDPSTNEVVATLNDESEVVLDSLYEPEVFDPGAEQTRPVDAFKDLRPTVTEQKPDARETNQFEVTTEEPEEIVVQTPKVKFRVNADIEEMTFGVRFPSLNFYVGRVYEAPRDIYNHLESKGLIYH